MWSEACALLDQAERRHRQFYELLATVPAAVPAWEPPANIFTLGSDVFVEMALPGARFDDVTVRIMPSGLLIEADVPPPAFLPGVHVLRMEVPYGRMRRQIELPSARYAMREHRLEHGCLFLRLTGSSV